MFTTCLGTSASSVALFAALPHSSTATNTSASTNHAHATAAKFWATKNFAAYGRRGTWSSIR